MRAWAMDRGWALNRGGGTLDPPWVGPGRIPPGISKAACPGGGSGGDGDWAIGGKGGNPGGLGTGGKGKGGQGGLYSFGYKLIIT